MPRVQGLEQAKRATAVGFLRAVIKAFPHELHTVLTDNGIQFTHRAQDRRAFRHLFDHVCAEHDIEHRLTKIGPPWTNGQVERMNRTLKEATVKPTTSSICRGGGHQYHRHL